MARESISLFELNTRIKELIRAHADPSYWVVAEISELKVNYSGHCYLELIEKDLGSERIVATNRATIWAQNYQMIKAYFETTTGQRLQEGLKVLIKVRIEFHELYRLSLNVLDIEPGYTVGELAIQKQKTIERLIAEGVFDMNTQLELPLLCRRIAVISSATAAGYSDFRDQLEQNSSGFRFYCKLFPAVMQGNGAEDSIVQALDRINTCEACFDLVVIIRGGGAKTDMNCFNSYWLAYHVCQFPLPVITGIGHEQDDSIVDLVAHTRLKTPTAVAAFLVDRMAERNAELDYIVEEITGLVQDKVQMAKQELARCGQLIQLRLKERIGRSKSRLAHFVHGLSIQLQQRVRSAVHRLEKDQVKMAFMAESELRSRYRHVEISGNQLKKGALQATKKTAFNLTQAENKIRILDPQHLLQRGYSITTSGGVVIRDARQLSENQEIETCFGQGKIVSTVKKVNSWQQRK